MDTLSQPGSLPWEHAPTPGRRVRPRKPAPALPDQPVTPAFLTHRFLPLASDHPVLYRNRRVQGEFFRSVDHLARLYRLVAPEVTDLPYPLNIHAAFVHLKQQLERAQPALSLAIVQTNEGITTLATAKEVDLQGCLYYIPLRPIFRLLRRKKAREVGPILLGIAAYIRQKMEMPCYSDWGSYMANVHGILEQWVDDMDGQRDEKEAAEYYSEFRRAEKVGYYMQQKLRQPARITKLTSCLQTFDPVGEWQVRLRQLAGDFIQLDHAYPNRSLFEEIPTGFLDEEARDEDRVSKDQYLSFVYDHYSWLGEEVNDYVETSLQECPIVDVPVTVQFFHEPQCKEAHDPTYEVTCLRLLNEFAYLLNNIDHEEY
jgi:hypothetical protein